MRCLHWADAMYSWHWLRRSENGSTEERNYLIIRIPGENHRAVGVSEWLLFKANSAIFQLYHGDNKLSMPTVHCVCSVEASHEYGWVIVETIERFISQCWLYFVKKGLFIKTPCEEKFEDTNGVIISLTLKRTDNTMAKTKTDKRTNNDLQNITLKT
jgi:hypothetical protein